LRVKGESGWLESAGHPHGVVGMAQEPGTELIGGLPIQTAPQQANVGLPRLRMAERRQVALRAVDLEALVADDHRVRLVWSFVEGVHLAALYGTIRAVEGWPGHPPAGPAHPAGAVALCDRARNRQSPRVGAAVRGAHRISVAVWRRWDERQDAGGLPGGTWHGGGAVAGRQLRRAAQGRCGEAGSCRPGWRASTCRGRGGVVPSAQHAGGLSAGGRRAGAPAARRTRAGSRRGQPTAGGGAPAGGGRPRAAGQGGIGGHRNLARQQQERRRQRAEREARKPAVAQPAVALPDAAKPQTARPEAEKEPWASTTDAARHG